MTPEPDSTLVTLYCPSPNFDLREGGRAPDILLLHYTGMESTEGALAWLTAPEAKVSSHYLVDEQGRVTQLVREEMRAWHAGNSHWAGEDDINSCSIGIEIHNPGHEFDYPDFPKPQMDAVEALCLDIFSRHEIPRQRVLAHSDVAPQRKRDPGEKFNWRRLASAGIGLWVKPEPIGSDDGLGPGDEGAAVRALQTALGKFGYGLDAGGSYDEATLSVVRAFQRHWRPDRVDGLANSSTITTLDRLLAMAT